MTAMSRSRPPQPAQHNTSTSKALAISWAQVQFRRGERVSAPHSRGASGTPMTSTAGAGGSDAAQASAAGGAPATEGVPYATTAPRCRAFGASVP
jgi:hypothetical protein